VLKIDRLIKLPNDVLLNILERVGTLDAIRTCVVSRRTQNLPVMLSQIIIVLGASELHRHNRVVVEVSDKILSTRSPLIPLRKLKLRFIMRGDDHLRIGRSVALAMASQEIDVAEFEVMTKQFYYTWDEPDDHHYFAKQFNGFIGECRDAFAGLTRLHLQHLRFGQSDDIRSMLSTCKRLQSLSFFGCDAGESSVLHVEHPQLIELDIKFGQFLRVELDCLPKLQRMSYNTWFYELAPLVLGFVPQLSELTLSCGYDSDMTFRLSDMLVNVPPIENLHLDFQSQKVLTRLIFVSLGLFDG
jgi:hypothetical protein